MGPSVHTERALRRAAPDLKAAIAGVLSFALERPVGEVHVVTFDPLTVVVTEARAPLDETLVEGGATDVVRRGRDGLRRALEGSLGEAVKRATGLDVECVSGSHDPPSGIETLVFELGAAPDGDGHGAEANRLI